MLVRNANNALPLSTSDKIVVTGPAADSIPDTLGGWSVGWQGVPDGSPERAVTVLKGLQSAGGSNVTFSYTWQKDTNGRRLVSATEHSSLCRIPEPPITAPLTRTTATWKEVCHSGKMAARLPDADRLMETTAGKVRV